MGLNIWHREDVRRILFGTGETMREALAANPARNQEYADAYRAGFLAALELLAIQFGLIEIGGGDECSL